MARANITDQEAFILAGKELGFTEVRRNTKMRGYMGNTMKADVTLNVPGANYDIGLVKGEGKKFDMIADWWGIRKQLPAKLAYAHSDTEVQDALLRLTTRHTITRTYARQGFTARVTENADRSLKVVLTR